MPSALGPRIDLQPGDAVAIPEGTAFVQFTKPLHASQHQALGQWLAMHPDTNLRVYGNYRGEIKDLEFLRSYRGISGFEIDSIYRDVPDLAGLRYLPDSLTRLRLGVPSGPEGDLLLRRCVLTELAIARHRKLPKAISAQANVRRLTVADVKNIDVLAALTHVEDLTLASVTVPNLSALLPMRDSLQSLRLTLGGTRDLSLLPHFNSLRYLELVTIRGFEDLSMLGDVPSLEHVKLEAMKNVVALPDLGRLTRLRELELHTMKGLTDIAPVAAAPNLEKFWLTSANHMQPDVLKPLVGHSALREARVGFGSDRKNRRAHDLLGL